MMERTDYKQKKGKMNENGGRKAKRKRERKKE